VTARSKAWVCGLSLAGIAGSNPRDIMDASCHCQRALRWADPSPKGIVTSVVSECD